MSGRARRTVEEKPSRVAGALAQLAAAKAGEKRALNYEVKQDDAIYDVVDEEQYEQITAKRRMDAEDFLEDDDGQYLDEEDDFINVTEEAAEDKDGAGKKRKGQNKDGPAAKRKGGTSAPPKDLKAKERMQQMFAKAAAMRTTAAPKADDKSSDALLDDILGDLGPAPPTAKTSALASGFSRTPAAPPITKTFQRPSGRGSGGSGPSGGSAAGVRGAGFSAARAQVRPAGVSAPVAAAPAGRVAGAGGRRAASWGLEEGGHAVDAMEEDAGPLGDDAAPEQEFSFGQAIGKQDDGVEVTNLWGKGGAAASGATTANGAASAAAAAAGRSRQQQQQHVAGTPPVAVKQEPGATAAAEAATPAGVQVKEEGAGLRDGLIANPSRLFAESTMGPAIAPGPATGWMEVYEAPVGARESASPSPVPSSPMARGLGSPEVAVKQEGEGSSASAASPLGAAGAAGVGAVALEADGKLGFYFLDAYENPDMPECLFMFGKVPVKGGGFQSCCAQVNGLHCSLLVVPAPWVFADGTGEIAALEAEVAEQPDMKIELIKLLHSRASDLKTEVRALLLSHGVKNMRVVPVKRKYAFEDPAIPHGEQWVLKVRYPASEPQLPVGLTGQHFRAIYGTRSNNLESLLLKRKLTGPSWLSLDVAEWRAGNNMVSWCKSEVVLASSKSLAPAAAAGTPLATRPPPPLVVASLSLKMHNQAGSQSSEILAASVVHLGGVSVDAPMTQDQWNTPAKLRNFSVVRKLDGRPWPAGFEAAVAADNASPRGRLNNGTMITTCPNERTLLGCLLAKLQGIDADVLVGHNISAFDLPVLLHRLQHHKVQQWSRIGRLRRNVFPKLTGGGHVFGGGASPGVMTCLAGRLLCDTYLSARELVREVDYTLKTLARSQLGQERGELPAEQLVAAFDSAAGLRQVLMAGESDAWLGLGLMFQLSVLPLTKQLTCLSGSIWNKTLQGARAQRIEMLLLHEFHDRKFVLPEKLSAKDKAALTAAATAGAGKGKKGKKASQAAAAATQADGPEEPSDDEAVEEVEAAPAAPAAGGGKKAKGPQYAGGLVLEPKKGLYDHIVIMLDFNSLYPSIIQEYNICFTTVSRPADGSIPPLPENGAGSGSSGLAPLPVVIQGLVRKRREVKAQMKNCRDPVLHQQLHIRQQAIKLTANSMYGCLGFSNSRFYARPLAELITSQGREILQSTVDMARNMANLEVIYGDTDSIMIHTGTSDVAAARQLGANIKREVNRRYRLLEIELDAVYKTMLLLKKKKYAAIKLEPTADGGLAEVMEAKGLDIVRRDWCPLSKDCGNYVLQQILSGQPKEEVVAAVHEHLREVAAAVAAGQVPMGKFVITKQLTKRLEDYPDAKNQPHVQVALRRRAAGKRDGVMPGETVPYIICRRIALEDQQQQQEQQQPGTPRVKQEADTTAAAAPGTPVGTPSESPSAGDGGDPSSSMPQATPAAAAGAANGGTEPKQEQQQQQAATGPAGGGAVVKSESGKAAGSSKSSKGGGGGFADKAFHPEELREDPTLVVDREYYLGQQVHPVVARLCAPIEGTDPARLAECLGLDHTRYHAAAAAGGGSMAASLREEALQVTGSLLDDDSHYADCTPLTLKAPNGSAWDFKGIRTALKEGTPGDALLCPPDAVGDPGNTLTPAQLSNQVVLAARRAISKYYTGQLHSDDEMVALETRDVVMRPLAAAQQAEAAAAGLGSVLPVPDKQSTAILTRVVTEDQLYRQLSYYARLMDVSAALNTLPDQGQKDQSRKLLGSSCIALEVAAAAAGAYRDASAYRWVNLGSLFGQMKPTKGLAT